LAQRRARSDIQALRAVAVAMVLIYHLWPAELPGGFAGVDTFFVISGFLITSHLLASPPRTPVDLLRFWSRRIRRLLPAALLVLAVTLAASRWLTPDTQWDNTAKQARAAALYVVNWRLAADAVDYLASSNKPTPVQHFWSLSVEEQFYLGWPVLIFLLVLAGALLRRGARPIVAAGLAVVAAASLWYSIRETATDPARAYFVTWTRVWELGAGGVLAALVGGGRRVRGRAGRRSALALVGFAAVVGSGFAFDGATPFPSWRALLPVLGAVLVIAAAAPDSGRCPGRLWATRPIQWLGGVSYSLYLWHWPLIVLVPYLGDGRLSGAEKIGIAAGSLVLAGLTKTLVEDPFRRPAWGRPLLKPYALAAVGMAIVVGGAALQIHEVSSREEAAGRQLRGQLQALPAAPAAPAPSAVGGTSGSAATSAGLTTPPLPRSCFGAAALTPGWGCAAATASGTLIPSPLRAANDRSDAYASVSGKSDCFAYATSFRLITCSRGDPHATLRVALVGNSHAGEWLPPLERIATQQHWRLTTYLASQCAFADTAQTFPTHAGEQGCQQWTDKVRSAVVAGHYNLVVMTNRISVGAVGHSRYASGPLYTRGYLSILRAFSAAHLRVVGIRDTPYPRTIIPDCLASNPNNYQACAGHRSSWLPPEPLLAAATELHDPKITTVDLTNRICQKSVCPAAVGHVPVYFDGSHLTATYATTLAPYLEPYLLHALGS
jgi:peptidoglycan/LPS O-acetylase OafA/YrhL